MFKTSLTDPLNVNTIPVGSRGGAIGLTFAPGKYQEIAMTGAWARDLDLDLRAIRSWGARHLVTLIEPWEFQELRIQSLPRRAAELGLVWHGLPITDGAAPDDRLLDRWTAGRRLGRCSLLSFWKVRRSLSIAKVGSVEQELWHPCSFSKAERPLTATMRWPKYAKHAPVLLKLRNRSHSYELGQNT